MFQKITSHIVTPPTAATDAAPTSLQRICVVTGGSSGIGAAVCGRAAGEGWRVMSVSRRPCGAQSNLAISSVLVDLAGGADGPGAAEKAAEAVVEAVRAELQGTKAQIYLIHGASNYPADSAASVDLNGLSRALELNVTQPARLTTLLLPLMAPGSSVLFVGSTLSEKAVGGKLSYCTAKHAMVGLMRATAQDLLWSGIHTALVCPGITDTEMVRQATAGHEHAFAEFVSELQGRMLEPSEVADAIWNVARSPVLHGAIIHCNNGQKER
mmetsp:Transcript_85703/g.170123  ORF Transcript_85703/g.170123 Transcript_85703/m.170123 type:complete len:269 (+) Transcript_85703:56-862(+)